MIDESEPSWISCIPRDMMTAAATMNTIVQDILHSIVRSTAKVMLTDKLRIIKTISNRLKIRVNNSLAVAPLILKAIPT
jgi:hypothetical protein